MGYLQTANSFIRHQYIFIVPLVCLLVTIPVITRAVWLQTKFGRAEYYRQLAKKFPPNTIEAKRFTAIAVAIEHNQKYYTFEINHLPAGQ